MQSNYSQMSLSDAELNLLSQWLDSDETAHDVMSLMQLKGYLFALICAPSPVEDELWLKEALADDLSALSDDKLFALMALYNDLSTQVFETGFKLPKAFMEERDVNANFTDESELHLWSKGFVRGIGYAGQLLECENIDIDLRSAFAMAVTCLSYFADETSAHMQSEQQKIDFATLSSQMLEMMPDFASGFAELVEALAVSSGLFNDEGWD
ncbi:UPF0149 family protein [Pseudoalteromonas denitrificans]|jgi:uncharacterized protein|uniref:YecA family protein n=1 Tax=Pseudoalteromonas denitrificans DSM 6059 TaxID=1123010 RepID=A0A1I1QGI4_9GAMM|nr:UPF0149 family protein [Pseudoalteromonas denitrificans]SFD21176.1 uncharacterized protein SAMN02745724_03879 [Pseudoalteromonas denitrificans DSM 6059]